MLESSTLWVFVSTAEASTQRGAPTEQRAMSSNDSAGDVKRLEAILAAASILADQDG